MKDNAAGNRLNAFLGQSNAQNIGKVPRHTHGNIPENLKMKCDNHFQLQTLLPNHVYVKNITKVVISYKIS